jgi:hypothetical protein
MESYSGFLYVWLECMSHAQSQVGEERLKQRNSISACSAVKRVVQVIDKKLLDPALIECVLPIERNELPPYSLQLRQIHRGDRQLDSRCGICNSNFTAILSSMILLP